MKRCPTCDQTFDDTQSFCANDGTRLMNDDIVSTFDPMATIMATPPPSTGDINPPQSYNEPQPYTEPKPFADSKPFADPTPPPQPSAWMSPEPASPANWTPPPAPSMPYGAGGQQNGLAIASLICGVLSLLCFGFLSGIPAVVLGFMQLNKIKSNPATYGGKGLAMGGMITGGLGTLIGLLFFVIWLLAIVSSAGR